MDIKYQDMVYLNLQIDEQNKLRELAEIVDPTDKTVRVEIPPPISKTKNTYILHKEANAE